MNDILEFDEFVRAVNAQGTGRRIIVAIAGAPGSGKSTFADRLADALCDLSPASAALLPMDGYHYDDSILNARGLRARKGAPETFDTPGLFHMLDRLRRNEEEEVAVPVFDRDLEISRAGARLIPRAARVIVVEGNYLLLDRLPWSLLHPFFDITVFIDLPENILRARLVARWTGYGLQPAEIDAKVDGNDIPNGRQVISQSRATGLVLTADGRLRSNRPPREKP
ncbi:nucleoside triphosphate hydrolase [Radicibacter daui]|uniref:nucleoside triphosphate hydrolase n=1 Tax=Radicibacter daui TaxID=3064829 RepID=UPI004046C84B